MASIQAPAVLEIVEQAVRTLETLGCHVEQVDQLLSKDPIDLWTAEFYAGVGIRLRDFVENNRDLLDPAVANVLEDALSQDVVISSVVPVTSPDVGVNVPPNLADRIWFPGSITHIHSM